MYAGRLKVKVEDVDELEDLDSYSEKVAKSFKGKFYAAEYNLKSGIREHNYDFSRKSQAASWIKAVREWVGTNSDMKFVSKRLKKS